MTAQIVLRRPNTPRRCQPLLVKATSPSSSSTASARFAEVAGGTAAECAAVCCCCPCGLVNLVVLAVVKLPAGLCRKAMLKKNRKRKIGLLPQQQQLELSKRFNEMELQKLENIVTAETWPDKSPSMVVLDMEQEVWTQLYGTGFWRNPSEKEQ
ncbi:uncharacterized protein LOC131232942 [Magnolia sinica]|uniref:uncharacterized protein LOC131232942 n=1 Tax=Magnolia sinica TaxID=86752 RepID=UPI00265AE0CB|nr:uncharacterized protein LOC131232942 [Magnolia sinica]